MNFDFKPIKTEEHYLAALAETDKVFDAKPNTPDGDRLEMLVMMIEQYEAKHYPIAAPDPVEAIKFRMEQLGMSVSDLGEVIGYKSRASEILNRKRKLTLPMIRTIWQKMQIPAEVLMQDYQVAN